MALGVLRRQRPGPRRPHWGKGFALMGKTVIRVSLIINEGVNQHGTEKLPIGAAAASGRLGGRVRECGQGHHGETRRCACRHSRVCVHTDTCVSPRRAHATFPWSGGGAAEGLSWGWVMGRGTVHPAPRPRSCSPGVPGGHECAVVAGQGEVEEDGAFPLRVVEGSHGAADTRSAFTRRKRVHATLGPGPSSRVLGIVPIFKSG